MNDVFDESFKTFKNDVELITYEFKESKKITKSQLFHWFESYKKKNKNKKRIINLPAVKFLNSTFFKSIILLKLKYLCCRLKNFKRKKK
jgi:hypothetical protein